MSDNQEEMSFWDHLDVLRGLLFRSVVAVFLVSMVFLCLKDYLFKIVLAPGTSDFFLYKWFGIDFNMSLINIDISAQFFVHLKIAILSGLVVSFPYIIYEIWKFILPALYSSEKKAMRTAFGMASFLFYIGVLTGYIVVLPVCLVFFMNYSVSETVTNTISLSSYISMFTSMVFLIGIVFEFPTVIMVLNRLGIVGRKFLKKGRKVAFVIILVLSAIITPSDPFSMLVLAIPLYGLYELSILVCKEKEQSEEEALVKQDDID